MWPPRKPHILRIPHVSAHALYSFYFNHVPCFSLLDLFSRFQCSSPSIKRFPPQLFFANQCRSLKPRPERPQIETPGYHFVTWCTCCQRVLKSRLRKNHFCRLWSRCQKAIKSNLSGILLSTSGAKARKSWNRSRDQHHVNSHRRCFPFQSCMGLNCHTSEKRNSKIQVNKFVAVWWYHFQV